MPNKRKSYLELVKKLSLGLFNTLIDFSLFTIFFHLQSAKIAYGRDLEKAIANAIHATKMIHTNSLNRTIYKLRNKTYLEKKNDYFEITKLGQERLQRIIPQYDKRRPWDGLLYLITYDIPEENKRDRDCLRYYLKTLGCGLLQESVWLTPYNPKSLVVDFVKNRNLAGLVLVSELREGSGIGGKDILQAVAKVYKLGEINQEYQLFIKQVEDKKISGTNLLVNYLSILKKDPQLPFELLPEDWEGEEAFEIYQQEIKNLNKLS